MTKTNPNLTQSQRVATAAAAPAPLRCYAVSIAWPGSEERPETYINARTRGQAKVGHWRNIRDCFRALPYQYLRARVMGGPRNSDDFLRNAAYRGLPALRCGDEVVLKDGARGVITGHDASANFRVQFDLRSPKYPGLELSVHPGDFSEETINLLLQPTDAREAAKETAAAEEFGASVARGFTEAREADEFRTQMAGEKP